MDRTPQFGTGTFVWALATLCQLYRRPFSPGLALQHIAPPYTLDSLQAAAAALELRVEVQHVAASRLSCLPPPFVAVLKNAVTDQRGVPQVGATCLHPLAVVLRCDAQRVLYLREGEAAPLSVTLTEFAASYTGTLSLCAAAPEAVRDEDVVKAPGDAFGFGWFMPELLRHKSIWRDVLAASFAIQLIALAAPLCTQVIIDKVIVHQTLNTLAVIATALGIFLVFNAALSWVRQYLVLHTGNRVDAVLASRAFAHLVALPLRYFEHRPTGVLVARMHGIETIREFVSGAGVMLLLDLPFLFVFLAIMIYYSPLLSVVTVAVLAGIIAMSIAIVPAIRRRLDAQFLLGARNTAFMTEYVAGMETVKSLQMEPQLRQRFAGYLTAYLDASLRTRLLSSTYSVAANALEQLLTFSILCAGAWLVMQNTGFTVGMLVAYQMFASRLSQPLLRLVGLWQEFQQAAVAVTRLADVMNAPPEPYSIVPTRSPAESATIEVRGLAFRYAEHLPYLFEQLDLEVPAGECVALMGPSGSGKSTLAKLMQGFYLPTQGEIRIGGRDTRMIAANELRQCFGVVPQETTLFSGTVYDNLVLANPHASFEQVVRACRMAGLHEVIEALPQGYQTTLGERGVGLSGGQKQRLAIARALLKRARILVFDEATSNLDHETAEQFARTVNQLRGRVTMLFIAHQLPRGLKVDRTFEMRLAAARASAARPQTLEEPTVRSA